MTFFRFKMYDGRVIALAVLIFGALHTKFCVCIDDNDNDDNDIRNFIYNRIPQLQDQAAPDQFAVLILLSQNEVNNLGRFRFDPVGSDGLPIVNNDMPYSPQLPRNYIVSRPNTINRGTPQRVTQHAEEIALRQLPDMWNRFVNEREEQPAMVVLFTRLYPCTPNTGRTGRRSNTRNCAETIRNVLYRQQPYNNIDRVLAYNADDNSGVVRDLQDQNQQFRNEGFVILGLAMAHCLNPRQRGRRSVPSDTCQVPSRYKLSRDVFSNA